jgi:hypothetical protein
MPSLERLTPLLYKVARPTMSHEISNGPNKYPYRKKATINTNIITKYSFINSSVRDYFN